MSAAERIASRTSYTPKDARCVLEHTNGSACYLYERAGKPYAIMFWQTSGKPLEHFSYRTEDRRNEAVWKFRESVEHSITFRAEQAAKIKAKPNTFKVGDIVNTSWGYDQTNVSFYAITRVSQSCVWVRAVKQDYEATGHMCGRCWPSMPIEMVGEETRHVVRGGGFSIDGHGAHITSGDVYSSSYA